MTQKILLVEDDATTADFSINYLNEQGLAVDHAKNGRKDLVQAIDGSRICASPEIGLAEAAPRLVIKLIVRLMPIDQGFSTAAI